MLVARLVSVSVTCLGSGCQAVVLNSSPFEILRKPSHVNHLVKTTNSISCLRYLARDHASSLGFSLDECVPSFYMLSDLLYALHFDAP
jgi:hypothetical protein